MDQLRQGPRNGARRGEQVNRLERRRVSWALTIAQLVAAVVFVLAALGGCAFVRGLAQTNPNYKPWPPSKVLDAVDAAAAAARATREQFCREHPTDSLCTSPDEGK